MPAEWHLLLFGDHNANRPGRVHVSRNVFRAKSIWRTHAYALDKKVYDAFIALCRKTYGLEPEGLMCIPPVDEPPGPHFALLAKIAARNGVAKLSMVMSDDFETAIAFGATSVRVGSAIFGARPSA